MRRRCLILTLAGLATLCSTAAVRADDTTDFFNGKNFDGWEGLTNDYWSVKDGAIVGQAPKGIPFNTFLCTKKKYKDFELKFEVKLTGASANSGLQIRSELKDREKFVVWGPQCDMGQGYWGSLFGEHFGGKKPGDHQMMKAADAKVVAKVLKNNEFNSYHVKCVGKRVTIKLNGETTVDEEFANLPEEGILAWQLHSGPAMEVVFRNIQFTDLTKK
jgi:hypothetical protein